MLNNIKYFAERKLRAPFEVPVSFRHNYILLASFPKSGNTWLRFIISNIVNIENNYFKEVDFYNIRYLTPEIRENRTLHGIKCSPNNPVFLKTHFPYINQFKQYNSVLLYRHPTDVLRSYFRYLMEEKGKRFKSFNHFIKHWRYGVPAWVNFHKLWFGRYDYIIEYDKLIADPFHEVRQLLDYFNYPVNDSLIRQAILLSNRQNMRRILEEKGDPMAKNKKFQFISDTNLSIDISSDDFKHIEDKTMHIRRLYNKL